jgi:hypothetical protein
VNLIVDNAHVILPIMFAPLYESRTHWNSSMLYHVDDTLKLFMERVPRLYADCTSKYRNSHKEYAPNFLYIRKRKHAGYREMINEAFERLEVNAARDGSLKSKTAVIKGIAASLENKALKGNFDDLDKFTNELGSLKTQRSKEMQRFHRKSKLPLNAEEDLRELLNRRSLEVCF